MQEKKTKQKKNYKNKNIGLLGKVFMLIGIVMVICFFTKIMTINNQIDFVKYKIPDELNKQFFLDNNLIANDYIVNISNGYMVDKHTLNLPITNNSTFTFDKSIKGLLTMFMVFLTDAKYQVNFNSDYTNGNIKLILFNILKVPSSLLNFTLSKIDNSPNWLRESTIFGFKNSYILKDLDYLNKDDLNKIPNSALVFL
jgi:hypothetical protein